jgi:hypothetical protein
MNLASNGSISVNEALELFLVELARLQSGAHSLERAEILINIAQLCRRVGDLFEASTRLNETVAELIRLGYPQPADADLSSVFVKWCEAVPDPPGSSATDFLASLLKVVTLYAAVANNHATIRQEADPIEATREREQLEQLSALTVAINKESAAVRANRTQRLAALGLSRLSVNPGDIASLDETWNRIQRWNNRLMGLRTESERRGSNGDSQDDLLPIVSDLESEARHLNLPQNVAMAMTRQFSQRQLAPDGGQCHLRLECRVWFRRGRLLMFSPVRLPSWPPAGRNSNYPAVQILPASSDAYRAPFLRSAIPQELLNRGSISARSYTLVTGRPTS